jgi:hypothetical protein
MTNPQGDSIKFREQTSFLGYEFLTWVLLLLERRDSHEDVKRIVGKLLFKTEVGLILGNRLVTCLLNHKEQKTTINCSIMEDSHEVYASLKNGHVVEGLSLTMSLGETKVSFMLHAGDFAITQVKITNNFEKDSLHDDEGLTEEDSLHEEIFLRSAALGDLERVVDALYEHFLSLRVDGKKYATELATMREQVTLRLGDYLRQSTQESSRSDLFNNDGAQ